MNKLNLLLWGNLVLVLGAVNWITQEKEHLLANGRMVLLEVQKYDPPSLMQGVYMQLRYALSQTITDNLREAGSLEDDSPREGVVVLSLDENSVGTFRRFHKEDEALSDDEQLLRYKVRGGWDVRVAAESYLFQQGLEEEHNRARYAELRIDAQGHTLLVALRDKDRKLLGQKSD